MPESSLGSKFKHQRVLSCFGLTNSCITTGDKVLFIFEHPDNVAVIEFFEKQVFVSEMCSEFKVIGRDCFDSHTIVTLAIGVDG
jgi:hypothetical protein